MTMISIIRSFEQLPNLTWKLLLYKTLKDRYTADDKHQEIENINLFFLLSEPQPARAVKHGRSHLCGVEILSSSGSRGAIVFTIMESHDSSGVATWFKGNSPEIVSWFLVCGFSSSEGGTEVELRSE